MTCPYCAIRENKRERILKEGKSVFVVLSNPRLMPGHMLVIPKWHVLKLSELRDEERKELFDTVLEFQEKIVKNFSAGCDIRQNYRPFIAQNNLKIDHAHIHLLPREFEDELYQKSMQFEKEVFQPLSREEEDKFIKLYNS